MFVSCRVWWHALRSLNGSFEPLNLPPFPKVYNEKVRDLLVPMNGNSALALNVPFDIFVQQRTRRTRSTQITTLHNRNRHRMAKTKFQERT